MCKKRIFENFPFWGLENGNPTPGNAWMTSVVTAKTTISRRKGFLFDDMAEGPNFSNSLNSPLPAVFKTRDCCWLCASLISCFISPSTRPLWKIGVLLILRVSAEWYSNFRLLWHLSGHFKSPNKIANAGPVVISYEIMKPVSNNIRMLVYQSQFSNPSIWMKYFPS